MQTGLRLTFLVLFMGFASVLIAQTLVISGVVDFEALGNPAEAGIELYATHDIYDLSEYGLGSPSNGNGDNGVEFTFPADTVFEDECIYFTYNQIGFLNFFGFSVDYTNSAPSFLGDDVVQLFFKIK